MINNDNKDSFVSTFHYGKCPSCDKTIAVPEGTTKIYCCYCGEKFLSRAAIAFYGYKKQVSFIEYRSVSVKESEKTVPQKKEEPQQNYSIPKMMTVKEIASATGISQYGIRRMVKEGRIPSVNAGSKYLINYSKVCELINQGILRY